ncbi:hypothetical protein [uncultured Parasphingopyxis sp.]|uniref:hypothetical protein n=1 Tax=uncultured Parasphingopyxis sp. TaxID=1547918 RepID=UPI0026277E98|nr:hypothetical protein [uncultured Parasphingopyxis sp.]
MTRYFLVLAAFATLAAAAPGSAFQSADEDSDGVETNSATEIVCRQPPPPAGSRIRPRRICKTQAEWDRIADDSREALRDAHNANSFANGGAPQCTGGGMGNC